MFCGCELSFGDEPNVHTCPICLAHPGVLPTHQRAGGSLRAGHRPGAGLRHRPALDLPPQAVLLSRQPEGVPDQPVRHPACHERPPGGRSDPSRPPRGGRGEAHARRRVRAHPRFEHLARGLQPRRHPAGRDRHRARPSRWRDRPRMAPAPAGHDQADGRVRREHGGGQPPLRCQHLGPPGRLRRARDEDRAEEHELVPVHRARDRCGAGAPDRGRRGGRARGTGDPSLRPAVRGAHLAALEGGGTRLPLPPGARPGAAGADGGDAERGPRLDPGAARGAPRPLPG